MSAFGNLSQSRSSQILQSDFQDGCHDFRLRLIPSEWFTLAGLPSSDDALLGIAFSCLEVYLEYEGAWFMLGGATR